MLPCQWFVSCVTARGWEVEVSTWPWRPFPVKNSSRGSEVGQTLGRGRGGNRQDHSHLCECGGSLQWFYGFLCNSVFICEITDWQGCGKPGNTSFHPVRGGLLVCGWMGVP